MGYGPLNGGADDPGRKYRPDQPRVPAGEPGGGQWTSDGGSNAASESLADDHNVIPVARRHGGIPRALWNLTVRQFVSKYCDASINTELPGQFENVTLAEVLDLAKGGDAAARSCKKLLERGRFRK